MKYTINRTKWLRGENCSYLLRDCDGKMCCLGQIGKQCGVPNDGLLLIGPPQEDHKAYWPEWFSVRWDEDGDEDVTRAMRINDDPATTDGEKEAELTAIFARHGDELEFIN